MTHLLGSRTEGVFAGRGASALTTALGRWHNDTVGHTPAEIVNANLRRALFADIGL